MQCPKCKTVALNKSSYGAPGQCAVCHGLWLEDGGQSKMLATTPQSSVTSAEVSHNDHFTGLCPAGHGIMIRARVELEPAFYLEKCTSCNGIWFDAGEWERIVENNLLPELNRLWSNAWQEKQRKQRSRKEFLALNRELLGEEVYTAIVDLADALKLHPHKDRAIAFLQHEIQQTD